MTTRLIGGPRVLEGERDAEGYRTYKAIFLVQGSAAPGLADGPANVMQTPGLPLYGSIWHFGGDIDVYAWCRWGPTTVKATSDHKNEPVRFWEITFTFGTKPPDLKRCQDNQIQDPLLIPPRISGGAVKYTEEATQAYSVEILDGEGNVLDDVTPSVVNSAHEQLRGPQVEFDQNRSNVKIVQNVADLQELFCLDMVDTVNQYPIWGFPARCVKLSSFTWERKFYGTCYVYYERTFEFDKYIKRDPTTDETISGFDRDILDEGTKVIRGRWETDPGSTSYKKYIVDASADRTNPADFIRFKDFNNENAKVLLDGYGAPATSDVVVGSGTGTMLGAAGGRVRVKKYPESDFLLLGIPTSY